MSSLRQAAEMAQEALALLEKDIEWQIGSPTLSVLRNSKKALHAALAEPQGEPVYWEYKHVDDGPDDWQRLVPRTMQPLEVALAEIQGYRVGNRKLYEVRPLYTAPPKI